MIISISIKIHLEIMGVPRSIFYQVLSIKAVFCCPSTEYLTNQKIGRNANIVFALYFLI